MHLAREVTSIKVIARFCLRTAILVAFAAFSSIGFARSLLVLLCMASVLSAVLAAVKREKMLGRSLNHWDEMAVYAALCCLLVTFDPQTAPV